MDQKQIVAQMLLFNKTAFDNSFKATNLAYEQNLKMLETFLSQAAWLPEDGKKAIRDWMDAYKTGCKTFKKSVDDSYSKVEAFFK